MNEECVLLKDDGMTRADTTIFKLEVEFEASVSRFTVVRRDKACGECPEVTTSFLHG